MTLDSLVGGYCVGRVISPSSALSDALPLFLFFSRASSEEARVGVGVGG